MVGDSGSVRPLGGLGLVHLHDALEEPALTESAHQLRPEEGGHLAGGPTVAFVFEFVGDREERDGDHRVVLDVKARRDGDEPRLLVLCIRGQDSGSGPQRWGDYPASSAWPQSRYARGSSD